MNCSVVYISVFTIVFDKVKYDTSPSITPFNVKFPVINVCPSTYNSSKWPRFVMYGWLDVIIVPYILSDVT